jgi:eukaryotic-like serine/threonine-protein kinase
MTPEVWEKVTELFHEASELPAEERSAFLDEHCSEDAGLRREVESLLAAESEAGDFINEPIVPVVPLVPERDGASPRSLVGGDLGHYRIEKSIGAGGMGDVYLATDTTLNRKVALKTLPAVFARDPNFVRRFRNEAQAAAGLNHPNVATIYSVAEINGRPLISMEYVEGKTLDSLIPDGGLDLVTFVDWFTLVSDALAHAHERGVIHRDVKPGNIMITDRGIPKVLDFGLAQVNEKPPDVSDASLTQPGQIIGTPSYMSPEQAEGKDVDERSDIFSLGVVMYEALTGQRPFTGGSHAEIVSNLLKSPPPPIAELRPELPTAVVGLIHKCLNKSRRGRFQSMREVNSILSDIWATITRGPGRSSSLRRLYREFSPATPWRWIAAASLFVLISAVGARYYFLDSKPVQAVSFADLTFRNLSQAGNVVYAHITPDGSSIVYNAIDPDEKRSMWIRRVEERNALELLPPQNVAFWGGLTISDDGTQIFYITADWSALHGTLHRMSSLGGQPRKLVDRVNDLGSLSPDGQRLLYVRYGPENQILTANAADGSDEQVHYSVPEKVIVRDPQFSSDGKRLYVSRVENVGRNELWSLIEVTIGNGSERVILSPRRERINEINVLAGDRALLINQEDPFSRLNQLYLVDPATGTETRITNDLNSYFGLSVSRDGNSIVTARRSFSMDIWVGEQGNESSFRRITPEPTAHLKAEWAASGVIVYDAVDNNLPHIWSVRPDGSSAQQLTPNDTADYGPVVSPDGKTIVFVSERSGERKIWRMNIDGSSPVMVSVVEGPAVDPRFTADGRHVIYKWHKKEGEVLVTSTLEGEVVKQDPLFSDTYWRLSPDGSQVVYALSEEGRRASRLAIQRLDAAEPHQFLDVSPISLLDWMPDGKSLIYRLRAGGDDPFATVWRHDLTTGERRIFYSAAPDNVFDIALAPDNKRMAVVRGKLKTDAVMLTKIEPQRK